MDYILKTNSLSKSYFKKPALQDVSISVPKGSIYGLVGRNGAGKTTLMRLICGLQDPTSGDFELYGESSRTRAIWKARRRMGAVVETPAIYPDMTARSNLKQQYRVLGLPSFDGIDEILKTVGLEDVGNKKVRNFSLGMRQRMGIAAALAGEPDLLVLDEPINGLDPQGIVEMRELILKLNRERLMTVIISSHILDELAKLATHYGFIDKGHLIREMSSEELEAACRKCVQVTVSDTGALAGVLDEMGLEYKILDEKTADIYGQPSATKLVQALAAAGCELMTMKEHDESLEGFFLSLVGGEENA